MIGIYSNVRMDDRLCLLVIISVTEQGCKELVVAEDGYRESETNRSELPSGLWARGLTVSPKRAIGDSVPGFLESVDQMLSRDVPSALLHEHPVSVVQIGAAEGQGALQEIWMTQTRDDACKVFGRALTRFGVKYPGAVAKLRRNREGMLTFYDFPADTGCTSGRSTHRINIDNDASENPTDPKLQLPEDHSGNGLQVAGIGPEEQEADQGI